MVLCEGCCQRNGLFVCHLDARQGLPGKRTRPKRCHVGGVDIACLFGAAGLIGSQVRAKPSQSQIKPPRKRDSNEQIVLQSIIGCGFV